MMKLQQLFDPVVFEHVEQGVVERPQVRIHLLLQRSRQEAQSFTRFDGGTREHNAADLLRQQGGDGHEHGEVGFAGTGGSDAEDHVAAFDRFDVSPLIDGFRGESLLPEIALPPAFDETAEGSFRIAGYDAKVAVQVAVVEGVTFFDESEIVLEDVRRAGDVVTCPLEFERVVEETGFEAQSFLKDADIFVSGPK